MKRIIILSLFSTILTGYNLTAQEKHLFLQIDTLEYYDKLETILNFKINIGNQGFLNYGDIVDSNYVLSFNTTPNYTASFSLKNENSIIEIPIDSNGSEIHIYNSYKLKSDTIRINRLSLYETQTNDTTYTIIEHYKVTNGQLNDRPYKVKKNFSTKKEISPPNEIEIILNDKKYMVALNKNKEKGIEFKSGHRYNKKNHLDRGGELKKRLKYFYIKVETIRYNWFGLINL